MLNMMVDPYNLPQFVYLHKNHKYRLKLGFSAAPSNPKIFSKAVNNELNKLKFTYCSDLNGLVMGFGKISSNELIQADAGHCINVVVYVDVYIFRPPVGSIIEAIVNQTSENHISCLVHNLFNVSVVRPEHQPYNQWPGSKIKKDDRINVKVLSFDLTKKLPHITGDIVDKNDDEQDNYSQICSSSVSGFVKNIKRVKKQDISSSNCSSSDSESSDEEAITVTRSKNVDDKLTKTSQLNQNTINHIQGPLFSSTPVSGSEHSVSNINLIRNKQVKQLHKHLAKNAEKRKSIDYVKSPVMLNSPTTSIIKNNNSDNANEMNEQGPLQSDLGISDDDRKQINYSIQNSFSNTSKTIKKHRNSDKIVGSLLHSSSQNKKIVPETTVLKDILLYDSNTDHSSNDDEENSVYTQHIHDLKNSVNEMLNDSNNISQKIDFQDGKNKTVKKHSNNTVSMISDSESSSEEFPIKEINDQINLNKEIENNTKNISLESKENNMNTIVYQYANSSHDETYTKSLNEHTKSNKIKKILPNNYGNNSSSTHFSNKTSPTHKVLDTDNSLLEFKKTCKNLNKTKQLNMDSTLEKSKYSNNKSKSSPNLINKQNEIDKHIMEEEEDSSSYDEVNLLLTKELLKKKKKNKI